MQKFSVASALIAGLLAAVPIAAQTISTIAGNGTAGFSGENGPAASAQLDTAYGVATDAQGNTYIADTRNHRVRKISDGVITTVAGKGTPGFSGDGGSATSAELQFPRGVAVDSQGNLFIADTGNSRIRKVGLDGKISTVAGSADAGFAGDGGTAIRAQLSFPRGVAVDAAGNVFIADSWNFRVRKVSAAGIIQTVAGNGSNGPYGDGGQATAASLGVIEAIAFDKLSGNIYLSDPYNHRVLVVSTAGIISTVVGGAFGVAVDGRTAQGAALRFPKGIAADAEGNLFLADSLNHRVRKVGLDGSITTVAGNGAAGFSGDGGPGTSSQLSDPAGLAADPLGRLRIADLRNYRIRNLDSNSNTSPTQPVIRSLAGAADGQPVVVPGSYVAIYGSNLATDTGDWSTSIVSGQLPTQMGGVSVTMGGKPAYVSYISPSQINVLAPQVSTGPLQVQVANKGGASAPFTTQGQQYGPAFFLWGKYAVATHQDGSWCAKAGLFPGSSTTPAKPGEWITLWGTGFGPSDVAWGSLTPTDRPHSSATVTASVGGVNAPVYSNAATLAPGFAGLYQVAVQIPSSVPDGDAVVRATVGGVQSSDGVLVAVQR